MPAKKKPSLYHWGDTEDVYQNYKLPQDTEKHLWKPTGDLFIKYGEDVPIDEWNAVLAGTQGTYSKVKTTDDYPVISQEDVNMNDGADYCEIQFPECFFEQFFAFSDAELKTKEYYHFADVKDRCGVAENTLNAQKNKKSTQKNVEVALKYLFFDKCDIDFPRQNYCFYYNDNLLCGVMCHFNKFDFRFWFLETKPLVD